MAVAIHNERWNLSLYWSPIGQELVAVIERWLLYRDGNVWLVRNYSNLPVWLYDFTCLFMQGTYVNIDDFKSKFQVLCNQLGHQDYPVKRVFNHQSM